MIPNLEILQFSAQGQELIYFHMFTKPKKKKKKAGGHAIKYFEMIAFMLEIPNCATRNLIQLEICIL